MMGCRWCEAILAVLIIIFALWPTQIFSATVSMWIVVVSAALLLIHAFFCRKCEGLCMSESRPQRTTHRRSRRRR